MDRSGDVGCRGLSIVCPGTLHDERTNGEGSDEPEDSGAWLL